MTIKLTIRLFLLIGFCSCSDNSDNQTKQTDVESSGFYIQNGFRQGLKYIDTIERLYNYWNITTTITNNSVAAMRLEINFLQKHTALNDSLKARVFLLPRRLTPAKPQFDPNMPIELRTFLDKINEIPVAFDTVLSPKGTCVMTFGILTEAKSEANAIVLKATDKSSSRVTLGLNFDLMHGNHYSIPCGQISFVDSKN